MKILKTALTLLLCVAVSASMGACAPSSKESSGTTPAVTTEQTPASTEESSAQTTQEEAWQSPTEDSGGIALPIFKEVTEYTYMLYEVAAQPYSPDQLILPELEKRTNVRINLDVVPVDGFGEKVSIMLAAEEMPDIIGGLDQKRANDTGIAGLTLNVYDYVNDMPNFKTMLETQPSLQGKMLSPTELYACYSVAKKTSESPQLGWIFRQDLMEKHNLSAPKNYDEFYELLKQLKTLYPNSAPWTERSGLPFYDVALHWGLHMTSFVQFIEYDYGKDEFLLSYKNPKLKGVVEFIKKAYNEGLLDQEAVLNTTEMWVAKMVTGSSFITYDWHNRCREFSEAAWANGESDFHAAYVPPFSGDGARSVAYGIPFATDYNRVVSKNVKNPNELMRFIDYWLYSKEGAILTKMGIEGETFRWTDDAKTKWEYLPFDANSGNISDLKFYYDMLGSRDLTGGAAPEYYGINPAAEPEDWTLFNIKSVFGDYLIDPPPVLIFNADENDVLVEYSYVDTYFKDSLTKFVVGEMNIDDWDAFVAEMDKLGAPIILDLFNANWNNRK